MVTPQAGVGECRVIAAVDGSLLADLSRARRVLAEAREAGIHGVTVRGTTDGASSGPERLAGHLASVVADAAGLEILVAPYDLESMHHLATARFGGWKIDPPLLTHLPLLEEIARDGRPVLAGIAGCTRRELDDAVCRLPEAAVLVHTVLRQDGLVDVLDVAHLNALQQYGRAVGYADGSDDTVPALLAVALGATVVEKPLTHDFRSLVARIRRLEQVRAGDGARDPQPDELDAIDQHRVSIVAARPIARGTVLDRDMLTVKAPGAGLSPRFLPLVEGRRVLYDIPTGGLVTLGVIEP